MIFCKFEPFKEAKAKKFSLSKFDFRDDDLKVEPKMAEIEQLGR